MLCVQAGVSVLGTLSPSPMKMVATRLRTAEMIANGTGTYAGGRKQTQRSIMSMVGGGTGATALDAVDGWVI